jgi:hypothetical protein
MIKNFNILVKDEENELASLGKFNNLKDSITKLISVKKNNINEKMN